MIIETATLIAFGGWLKGKLVDKGFDYVYEKLFSIDENDKFYEVVALTSKEIETEYPDVLGGAVNHFFRQEEVFGELVKFLFADSNINEEVISAQFDIETLPKEFVSNFIKKLRSNLLKHPDFRDILISKEIHISCIGIANEVNDILKLTTLSYRDIASILELLQNNFKAEFDFVTFKSRYFSNAENNLSQVHHIGLGVDLNIERGRRKLVRQIFVKPIFAISD
jgi:hypothetical protein